MLGIEECNEYAFLADLLSIESKEIRMGEIREKIVMLDLDISNLETLYQALLDEYQALEAETPLTPAVAMALGSREFERQLCQAWSAGQYSPDWLERMNQFSVKLSDLCAQVKPRPGDLWHDRLLKLQDDGEQINPAVVMRRMRGDTASLGNADTVADQLAQGATLCELF